MRKLLLSLTMLMAGAVAVWAQTAYLVKEPITTLTDGTYVLVAMSDKGEGPCYYSSSESGNRLYRYDLGVDVQVGNYIDNAQYVWTIDETTSDGVQKITVTNVGDPTKAFPVDGGKNQNFTGSVAAELITKKHTINGVDYFALTLEDDAIGYIHANAPGGNPNLSYWNEYADGGSCVKFRFYPVEAKIVEDRTITYSLTDVAGNVYTGTYEGHEGDMPTITGVAGYSLENILWEGSTMTADITFPVPVSQKVMINSFSGYEHWYYVSGTDVKITKTVPTSETVNNYLWIINPVFNEGNFTFTIKNVATNKYMTTTSTTNQHAQGVVAVTDGATEFTLDVNNQFKVGGKYISANSSSSNDQFAGTWDSHGGTKNKVYVADQISYTLTDNAGNIFEGSCEGYARIDEPTLTGAYGYSFSDKSWTEGNHFNATINFAYTTSKVGGATNAIFLSSYYNNQQWHAVDNVVKVQTAGANLAELNDWLWVIYPSFNNGAFTFTIKNIGNGLYVTANKAGSFLDTSNNNNTGADGVVTLTETGTAFGITSERDFAFSIGNSTAFLSINSDKDTDVDLGVHNNTHNGTNVLSPSFTDLSTYKVTISSAKAATLTTPIAVTLPEGVEAGYVSGVNTDTKVLTYTDVTTIPADESVVLFGEEGTYTFNKADNADAFENENYLVGYTVATDIPEGQTVYALGNKTNGVAFYTFSGTQYAAYKAYLQLPEAVANAIGYFNVFGEDGTTGIENSEINVQNSEIIYDLMGRRVETMTEGNIYIVNGRKVVR